ncbi:MAG: nuclear transport factor 2 family protein [Hyphomonadaceae bacterium]
MGSPTPQATAEMFFDRFNAGDAAGFARLYSHDAVFTYDGQEKAVGRDQIERAISGFMAAGLKMRGRNVNAYIVGDVALTRFAWELYDGTGATIASGVSTEVQQRGPDGLWQFIIDDTNGGSRVP